MRLAQLAWCALAFPAACGDGSSQQAPSKIATEQKQVRLILPSSLQVQTKVEVTGTLAPHEAAELGFQVPGRILSFDVDVGDGVAAAQAIASLDLVDFDLECARAEAALQVARVRLSLQQEASSDRVDAAQTAPVREAKAVLVEAGLARDRVRELAGQGLGSQAALDTAMAAVAVAQSRLQAAEEQVATWLAELSQRKVELALAQKRRQDAQLTAPFAGRIEARHAARGSYLPAGALVVTLLRADPLRLRLRVPERQAQRVAVGQHVSFSVDGEVDGSVGGIGAHRAVVRRLGPSIDLVDRTLLVEAEVQNADGVLRSGSFCRATIESGVMRAAVAVPKSAIASFAGVDRVYCVQDGRIKDALVELGSTIRDPSSGHDLVEVVRGLMQEQRIVADPRGLVPGMPVKTVD